MRGHGQVYQCFFRLAQAHQHRAKQIIPLSTARRKAHQHLPGGNILSIINQLLNMPQFFIFSQGCPLIPMQSIQAGSICGVDLRHPVIGPIPFRPIHKAIRMPTPRHRAIGRPYLLLRRRHRDVQQLICIQGISPRQYHTVKKLTICAL